MGQPIALGSKDELDFHSRGVSTKSEGIYIAFTQKEAALATAYENIKQRQLEASIKENEIVDNIVIFTRFHISNIFVCYIFNWISY